MDTELLKRYFQGKCSAEENLLVKEWFATPEGASYLADKIDEDLSQLYPDTETAPYPNLDSEKLFNQILSARAQAEQAPLRVVAGTTPAETPLLRSGHWYTQSWFSYAAALAGLVMLVFAFWFIKQPGTNITQTAYGETKTLTLPDGSTVILNGNSSLRYPAHWTSNQAREVWLDGEAFFSITHQPNKQKFLVNTSNNFTIEVLGTTFNVLKRDTKTKVVLNTGKIKVHIKSSEEKEEQLLMSPGELVEFDNVSAQYAKKKVNPEAHSSWKSKKMMFENTSMSEILLLLEHTYGLQVKVMDSSLLDQKVNGTIPNENVDVLLEGLSHLFNLKITKNNEQVIIEND